MQRRLKPRKTQAKTQDYRILSRVRLSEAAHLSQASPVKPANGAPCIPCVEIFFTGEKPDAIRGFVRALQVRLATDRSMQAFQMKSLALFQRTDNPSIHVLRACGKRAGSLTDLRHWLDTGMTDAVEEAALKSRIRRTPGNVRMVCPKTDESFSGE